MALGHYSPKHPHMPIQSALHAWTQEAPPWEDPPQLVQVEGQLVQVADQLGSEVGRKAQVADLLGLEAEPSSSSHE